MYRRIVSTSLFVLLALGMAAAEEKPADERLLAELKTLAAPLDEKQTAKLDADEIHDLHEKHAKRALEVIKTFESDHGKSKHVNDARLLTLQAISRVNELATAKEPIELAKRLRAATEKGTDHAAQADMFLVGADIRVALKGATSGEAFVKAWTAGADEFRKKIAAYLEDHPKYRPAADTLRGLVPLLELAGDTKTRDLILESVQKNQPDHPLARTAELRRSVGKEFDLTFTPVGAEKEMALKDLRGKVVVVNFWTSWCVPCRAELKQLQGLYEKHNKDGLEIVGISLDEKEAAAVRFIKRHKIAWRQVVGKKAEEIGEKYGIETVPVQFVIDRDGKLVSVDALGKLPELLGKMMEKK